MRRCPRVLVVVAALLLAVPALGHEVEHDRRIVIDTDMGMDDVVTLAMALQNPSTDIVAIVACEGVASQEKGTEYLERMINEFNRRDIPLYAPVTNAAAKAPPPFRPFAEKMIGKALTKAAGPLHQPFAPEAYVKTGGKTVVLAIGPLTNLAAALKAKADIVRGIEQVIVAGPPDPEQNWNLRYDPEALAVVQASGLPLVFVTGGSKARKPESWQQDQPPFREQMPIGNRFVSRLLADTNARTHYCTQFGDFHDELVFMYYADPHFFEKSAELSAFVPLDRSGIAKLFSRLIGRGRQHKERVVFADRPFPPNMFQEDIRERQASIIAKNGHEEWFALLLANELHEHMGAYSVIGVKMGLRAAELLNAPQHGMTIVSRVSASPPISCLNDGLIVATGSTPGRRLFIHEPGPPGSVVVDFSHNGRSISLTLKDKPRQAIRAEIKALLERYTLEDEGYWDGVRRLGIDIWENWHRRDLFEVVPSK